MASLRSFARRFLPKNLRLLLRRIIPAREQLCVQSYSQEGEDMLLRRIFQDRPTGFYVDVGAHHPKRFSNTYFFYGLGWSGINIEPNPNGYSLLCEQRSRDINIQAAVSNEPDVREYFIFDEPALNTFSPELASQYSRKYRLLEVKKMRLATLKQILDEAKPPHAQIDFMTVDVEGLDLQVLMSNDWQVHRPEVVVVEAIGMNFEQVLKGDAAKFMSKHGYEPFAKTLNSVLYRDVGSAK